MFLHCTAGIQRGFHPGSPEETLTHIYTDDSRLHGLNTHSFVRKCLQVAMVVKSPVSPPEQCLGKKQNECRSTFTNRDDGFSDLLLHNIESEQTKRKIISQH